MPVGTRSVAKTEVNKTAFARHKGGKIFTICRVGGQSFRNFDVIGIKFLASILSFKYSHTYQQVMSSVHSVCSGINGQA